MKKKYSALIALVLALVLGYFGINLNVLPDVTEPATVPTTSSVDATEPETTTLPPETTIPETTTGETDPYRSEEHTSELQSLG